MKGKKGFQKGHKGFRTKESYSIMVENLPNTKITKVCLNCSNKFYIGENRINTAKFCSYNCKYKFGYSEKIRENISKGHIGLNTKSISKLCLQCKKIFDGQPSNIGRKKFCSKSCYTNYQLNNKEYWNAFEHLKVKRIKINCLVCAEELIRTESNLKKYKTRFCSRECQNIWQKRNKKISNCLICNKEIIHNSDRQGKYCSNKCNGIAYEQENNPSWIDGSSFLPYPPEFNKRLKQKILRRDNYKCQECDRTNIESFKKYKKSLCIHHIDYDKQNCDEQNLISLCLGCHIKTNINRENWTEYFQEIMIKNI